MIIDKSQKEFEALVNSNWHPNEADLRLKRDKHGLKYLDPHMNDYLRGYRWARGQSNNEITKLRAQVAEQQWIPVSERWPDAQVLILALYRGNHVIIQLIYSEDYHTESYWVCEDHSVDYELSDITHWMPLPQPPANKDKQS